jgi:hypothetical protein
MRRSRLWPYLVLGLGLLVVGLAFWRPVPAGVWHDDGVYVITGRALAHGRGLHYVGVPGSPPAVKFPPGYPLFLAGLWVILGSLGPVTLAAELLNLVLMAAAGAVTAWVLRRHAGFSLPMALGAAAVGFASADVWQPALVPLSEPLFMLLAACALAAWGFAARPDDRRGVAALALLLVAAVLTRSAALAVVVGCGVALAAARGVRAALIATVPALATAVAWGAWAASKVPEIPVGARDILGPYGSWLTAQTLGAPKVFLADLPWQAGALWNRAASFLVPGLEGRLLTLAAIPLVALAVVGAVRLLRTFPALTWSLAAYFGMLMMWPFVERRLVAPAHPWVVVAVAAGLLEVARRVPVPVRRVLFGAAAVWVAAFAAVTTGRAVRGWAASGYRLRADRMANAIVTLEKTVPPGSVVGAPEFWPGIILHREWFSIPSARFTPRSEDEATPIWGTPEQQLALWWRYAVGYVLLEQNGLIHGDALNRLQAVCPGSAVILARMPTQMLVRLQWDVACAEKLGVIGRD